ncbi:hypothetical protein PG995_007906 [Apiospora arundinis]
MSSNPPHNRGIRKLTRLASDRPTKIVHVGHSDGSIVTIYLLLHGARATPMHRAAAPPLLTGFRIGPKFAQLEVGDARSCRGQAGFDNPPRVRRPRQWATRCWDRWQRPRWLAAANRRWGVHYSGLQTRRSGRPSLSASFYRWGSGLGLCSMDTYKGTRNGERDFLFCAGEGNRAYDLEQIKGLYPDSARVEVALQPETGLVLILSTSATAGYAEMCSHIASLMACGQRHNRAPTRR